MAAGSSTSETHARPGRRPPRGQGDLRRRSDPRPRDWRVESNVSGIGAARDTRPAQGRADDAPVLSLDGVVLFGGFGVMSDMPKDGPRELTAAVAKQRDHNGSKAPEVAVESAPTA